MRGTATVKEAIDKGRKMLIYPTIGLISVSFLFGLFLAAYMKMEGWIYFVTTIAGFVSAWIYWSYYVTRWRIWAFSNVRNVHELQRKAIENSLIWKEGSWFEKTEIRTEEDKRQWEYLKRKFNEPDVYHDDVSVPKETAVFYSKNQLYGEIFVALCLGGVSGFLILSDKVNFIGWVVVLIFIYMLFMNIRKLLDISPQLILNAEGITLKKQFYAWNIIRNERVVMEKSGKSTVHNLYLYHSNKEEVLLLKGFTKKPDEIEELLHVYRTRFNNQRSE